MEKTQAQLLAQHVQYSDRHQTLDVVLVRDAKADHLGVAAAEGRHEAEGLGDAHGLDREAGHSSARDLGDRGDRVLGCRANRVRGPHLAAHLQTVS